MSLISRYVLELGVRHVRAKRRSSFISFISLISMLGIALGVAALIVVISDDFPRNSFENRDRS